MTPANDNHPPPLPPVSCDQPKIYYSAEHKALIPEDAVCRPIEQVRDLGRLLKLYAGALLYEHPFEGTIILLHESKWRRSPVDS